MRTLNSIRLRGAGIAALALCTVCLGGLAGATGSASAAPAPASEWTQVRGGSGHTGDNPGETTITAANVRTLTRMMSIPDTGDEGIRSETLVGGGLFYVFSTAVDDPSTSVRAFNATTGVKVWSARIGSSSNNDTAALSGGRLFVLTASPVSAVTAFNASTGATLWKSPVGCAGSIAAEGDLVAVSHECDVQPSVKFLDASSGAVLGEGCDGDPDAVGSGGPSLLGGVAYLTSNSTAACISNGNPAPHWSGHGTVARFPVFPAVLSNAVYGAGTLTLRAWNAKGITQWKTGPLASERKWELFGMSVDDSQIYLAYRTPSGASALTAFSRATGARLWSDAIGIDAAPAVANGMVFTAEGNHGVSAYSAATGAPLWNQPGLADSAPPVVAGGRLYVGWAPAGSPSPAPLAVFALG